MVFTNVQIPSESLPSLEFINYEKLDISFRKMSLIQSFLISGSLLIIYGILALFEPILFEFPFSIIFLTVWLLFVGTHAAAAYFGYEKAGFALREHDILYKSGIFFQDIQVVPFSRIQHCELSQGPLERYFNLSSVTLFTAGGSSSDVVIEGLSKDKAVSIKNYILRNAASDEEE